MRKDEELMIEYQAGNSIALEEIYQRYKKKLLNYSFRLVSNRADAEDVVGQAFYIVTKNKDSYKPKAKFSTWIYTVVHNLCMDKLRRKKRIVFFWFRKEKESSEYQQWDIPDDQDPVNIELENKNIALYVKKAIGRLPLALKEAIVLREYQGLSYDQIGRILNCQQSKVKILIYRARQRLKKELLPVLSEGR